MASKRKKEQKKPLRDKKGRFLKGNKPNATTFQAADERPREAGKKSGESRREKGDLRNLCKIWMETEVATDKDGKPITGGQMMVRVAVKELAKGNPRFWELMRDTAGYKPVDKVMVSEVEQSVIDEVDGLVKGAGDEQETEAAVEEGGAPVQESGQESSEVRGENEPHDHQDD